VSEAFTEEETTILVSMLLKMAGPEGLTVEEVTEAFDELEEMRVNETMLKLTLANRIAARWDRDDRELKWYPA
jgi:uncharacterized protein (DUF433 family)